MTYLHARHFLYPAIQNLTSCRRRIKTRDGRRTRLQYTENVDNVTCPKCLTRLRRSSIAALGGVLPPLP